MFNEIIIDLNDNAFSELILTAEIIEYRESDNVLEYRLKGCIRFEPDTINKIGDPEGLIITLSDDQLREIDDYYNIQSYVYDRIKNLEEAR
jgi:hypothetical protein